MIKPALLLGTIVLSMNTFAASIADLNTALKAGAKSGHSFAKVVVYGGRDMAHPKMANADQVIWEEESAQRQIG